MRTSLLLGTALGTALALSSFAAQAADLVVDDAVAAAAPVSNAYAGYVAVYGSSTESDIWGDSYNPWVGFGIDAAVSYWLDNSLQVELEATVSTARESEYEEYGFTSSRAVGHLNWSAGDYSLGGFVGVASLPSYYYGNSYGVLAGLEGQMQLGDAFVIDGQIGYLSSTDGYYHGDGYPLGVAFGQIGVKYFPMDNLMLAANVGAIKGNVYGDGYDMADLTYGATLEYQLENTPFSVFASYSGTVGSEDADFDGSNQTIKIGAKFSFDGLSLKDQATSGASHKVMDLTSVDYNGYGW
ncbi:hypothetical protein [Devosia sp.]|uniref:hypothetical protein n=1 Tax=Devosia sp. TaxID=1871048 RepID=UPI003BAA7497